MGIDEPGDTFFGGLAAGERRSSGVQRACAGHARRSDPGSGWSGDRCRRAHERTGPSRLPGGQIPTMCWDTISGFSLLATILCLVLARQRWKTAGLAFVSFHLHLVCDLIGARGPEGEQWPIPYLLPFSNHWQLSWHGQWALNAWPNVVLTAIALLSAIYLAWRRGFSPLEIFSVRGDKIFVEALRSR